METVQNRISGVASGWFSGLSRGSRMGLVVVVAAVLLLAINFRESAAPEMKCSLLGTCQLTQTEIQQIELALGSEGIDDYQIEGGCVLVLPSKKPDYLKLLAEKSALPARLHREKPGSDMSSLFSSARQQKQAAREQKGQRVEEHISRFPFVEQTWIIVDVTRPQNGFKAEKSSVVVSVKPARNRNLSPDQIATIRRVISSAFNSTDDDDIVVADLNAERAYRGAVESNAGVNQMTGWQMMPSERQAFLEQEITQALREFEGVKIDVTRETTSEVRKADRYAMLPQAHRKDSSKALRKSAAGIGANSSASVEDVRPELAMGAVTPLPFAHSAPKEDAERERWAVSISATRSNGIRERIRNSQIINYWKGPARFTGRVLR